MRTEREIMAMVLDFAQEDERVRLTAMNGSRVNRNVPADNLQDYDIAFLVTDMQSFIDNPDWVDRFGKRIIMQTPETSSLWPPSLGGWLSYLMLFADGNRIDLMLVPLGDADRYFKDDSLTKILLDKDGIAPDLSEPSERSHWVKAPTQENFADCCNEFHWVSAYVAKGIRRREFLYAAEHIAIVRGEWLRMLFWQIGIATDFSVNLGKSGKYLERYLPPEVWAALCASYNTATYENCRTCLSVMRERFGDSAKFVAKNLGFHYDREEEEPVNACLAISLQS